MDRAFLTDTGELLHLEYQSTKESDLYRFLQYDTALASQYHRPVRTIVLYTAGREAPDRLDAGYLQYRVDNVFLQARDALTTIKRIEQHVRTGKWSVQDRLDLAFLPYMRHDGWTNRDVVAKTVQVAQSISDEDERNLVAALILLISAKNLGEEEILRLKEGLMMTDVVKIIARDEYEKGRMEGREEGLEKGHEEERIEIARRMLMLGIDIAAIMKVTGLTHDEVDALRPVN